jgi:hypothetical protein
MRAVGRPGYADQHHAVGALGIGEQRVTMVDRALEHPGAAGAGEPLPARVRRMRPQLDSAPRAASRRPRRAPSGPSRRQTPRTPCRRRPAARRIVRSATPRHLCRRARTGSRQHRCGPARVLGGAAGTITEQLRRCGETTDVVGADRNAIAERTHLIREREAVATAPGVDHRPVDAQSLRQPQHRQDGRDSDAARDEAESARGRSVARHGEREGVARPVRSDVRANPEVVHLDGAAATVGYPPHGDAVGVRCFGISHNEYCRTSPLGR